METTAPDREEILARAQAGTLADAMFGAYARVMGENLEGMLQELADLHREGLVDLVGIVDDELVGRLRGSAVFLGIELYRQLIPRLQATTREMLHLVERLRVAGGDDLMAGRHLGAFTEWCAADNERPGALLELVDADETGAARHLASALTTGVAVNRERFTDRAFQLLAEGDAVRRIGAMNALSRIEMEGEDDWNRLGTAFAEFAAVETDDDQRGHLLSATFVRMGDAPPTHAAKFGDIAIRLLEGAGPVTLHCAAGVLAARDLELEGHIEVALLNSMRSVEAGNKGTLDVLDVAFAAMVDAGRATEVREIVRGMVVRDTDPVDFANFDSVIHSITQKPDHDLGEWVVEWLLAGDARLCGALDRCFFGAGGEGRTLFVDLRPRGLSNDELAYLARKVVGNFIVKPALMSSFLVSILREAKGDASDEVEALLTDFVLKNYAKEPREVLDPIAADEGDPASGAVGRSLVAQEEYLEGLRDAGPISELHPSERERQLEWERHSDRMADAMQSARKKSIMSLIATESVMLHGARAVSWIDAAGGEAQRNETSLNSIGTSFEIPRIDVVDPIGLQMAILSFRSEKRPS